jgi:hypothetical protein
MKHAFLLLVLASLCLPSYSIDLFGSGLSAKLAKLDSSLLKDDLVSAKTLMDEISKEGTGDPGSADSSKWDSYQRAFLVLSSLEDFKKLNAAFLTSEKSRADFEAIDRAHGDFPRIWQKAMTTVALSMSQELFDHLNRVQLRFDSIFGESQRSYSKVEQERLKAAESLAAANADAQRKKDAQAENDAEVAQLAEQKAKEAQDLADAQAFTDRIKRMDVVAKKRGFKGLLPNSGIMQFLVDCQNGKDLESGLNYVFWTEITPDDMRDKGWALSQVVAGYEIYYQYSGPNRFTIAVKAGKKMPVVGQHLKGTYFVFLGNKEFTLAIDGTTRPIQRFDPVADLEQ